MLMYYWVVFMFTCIAVCLRVNVYMCVYCMCMCDRMCLSISQAKDPDAWTLDLTSPPHISICSLNGAYINSDGTVEHNRENEDRYVYSVCIYACNFYMYMEHFMSNSVCSRASTYMYVQCSLHVQYVYIVYVSDGLRLGLAVIIVHVHVCVSDGERVQLHKLVCIIIELACVIHRVGGGLAMQRSTNSHFIISSCSICVLCQTVLVVDYMYMYAQMEEVKIATQTLYKVNCA